MIKNLLKTPFLFTLAMLLLLTACIPSLQPFFIQDDVIFDTALVGTFKERDGKGVWTFTKTGEREYRLAIKDQAKSSAFIAHLFKLGKDRFLDLYPVQESLDDCPREDFFKSALVGGHLALKVPSLTPSLSFQVMDQDTIREYLNGHKNAVPYSLLESDRLVFTGSTVQMRDFLRRIASEEKLWGKPAEFDRFSAPE